MKISMNGIEALTKEYGGDWGINHTKRLLHIISIIGEGLQYNHEAVMLAAYIHDWGAYPKWAEPDVEHVTRSIQAAEEFLADNECEKDLKKLVLECIEYHHSATDSNSIEAILLSDADALDFLGVVGILRDFSRNPKALRKAYDTVKNHRSKLPGRLLLKKSIEFAEARIKIMDEMLKEFENETFGYF